MYKVTPQPHPFTVATCTIHQSAGATNISRSLILFEFYVTDAFVGCQYQRRRRQDPACQDPAQGAAEASKESDQKSG
jgi:hypothetical protein